MRKGTLYNVVLRIHPITINNKWWSPTQKKRKKNNTIIGEFEFTTRGIRIGLILNIYAERTVWREMEKIEEDLLVRCTGPMR